MLDVLQGHASWIKIEPLGDLRDGAEFVIRRNDGVDEAHQVKRQFGNANAWNSGAFDQLRIWDAALQHSRAHRQFHFVSTVPFRKLQELADRTRSSDDLASFLTEGLPNPLEELFSELTHRYQGANDAYCVLRGLYVRVIDDRELRHNNAALAALLLEGAPDLPARASLVELIERCLGRTVHASDLIEFLADYGLRRRLLTNLLSLIEQVQAETLTWLQRVEQQQLQPVIARVAAQRIRETLWPTPVTFLVGAAGAGKTAVLHQTVELFAADGLVTLVISLDRYGSLGSTRELGRHLGFETSPVTALAAARRPAVLVVDQLDAVSMVSGRLPENFNVVADLIVEARAFPDLRVVLGCRQFDVDNDHRIRTLMSRHDASVVSVEPLTDHQVDTAIAAMGMAAVALTTYQRDILRLPLHLSLLATIAHEPRALDFTNSQSLFDAYWDYKRRAIRSRGGVQEGVDAATGQLARAISNRQQLTVPIAMLDIDSSTTDLLISEQLLVRDGAHICFFHEALFDYAFARQWVRREDSLVSFLAASEQELFRRGQVRQIMTHLRTSDPVRFVSEVRAMLTSTEVRFHIKDVALVVLGGIDDPSSAELQLLFDVLDAVPELDSSIWSRLRTPSWFDRFDADGLLSCWLEGSEEQRRRAISVMTGVGPAQENRMTDLLMGRRDDPDFPGWVRHLARCLTFQSSHKSIEVLVDCVRAGGYDPDADQLWFRMLDVAVTRPDWVVEVLAAYFLRPPALEPGESGKIAILTQRYTFLEQVVTTVATTAPASFCTSLLPYLLQVMAATEYRDQGDRPLDDAHFSCRIPGAEHRDDAAEVLFAAMGTAIRAMAANELATLRPIMELLAEDRHDAAQWLLYQGFLGDGVVFADWAFAVMMQGAWRFMCGYVSNSVWVAREVLQSICPHLTHEQHQRLETVIRDLRFEWENRGPGWYAFNLLSGMCEERLTETGRRRLGEFRRRFQINQPPEPEGIVVFSVKAPIPAERARRMSDDNWLQAMDVHDGERETASQTGGAREQARVLEELTKDEPRRFAQLALRLTPTVAADYSNAILLGLGAASIVDWPDTVFEVVRHIASMNNADNDLFFGFALHPYAAAVPLDIVETLRDRMVNATDPGNDGIQAWQREEVGGQHADILTSGINTARGSLARTLAGLLAPDADGERTTLVVPVLNRMAEDPSVSVRATAALLVGASMRHAPAAARAAFTRLIDTDDRLLATPPVRQLLIYLGNDDPATAMPVVERMLASTHPSVREEGGRLATFAALEWRRTEALAVAQALGAEVRQGIAQVAAHRLTTTSETAAAVAILNRLFHDPAPMVRQSAADVAAVLRGQALLPFTPVLREFISSPAFVEGISQLLITLENAPDKIDDLVLRSVRQFITTAGTDVGDISTHAAAESQHVGRLIIRGLTQTDNPDHRSALLDAIDELIRLGSFGINDMVNALERG
ncbi:ATP-binding protein [Nocardia jinanensis]|nr:ATP-binding protein [Nocardia jinanensis]